MEENKDKAKSVILELGEDNKVISNVGSYEFRIANLSKTTCSVCNTNKVRLVKDSSKKVTRKYYEDDKGRPWNGRRCPDCVRSKAKEHMRQKRVKV